MMMMMMVAFVFRFLFFVVCYSGSARRNQHFPLNMGWGTQIKSGTAIDKSGAGIMIHTKVNIVDDDDDAWLLLSFDFSSLLFVIRGLPPQKESAFPPQYGFGNPNNPKRCKKRDPMSPVSFQNSLPAVSRLRICSSPKRHKYVMLITYYSTVLCRHMSVF